MRAFVWRLLLGAWVGALLCFGAVVAPALFAELARHEAGAVVRRIIPALDSFGMIAAVVLLGLSVGQPNGKRTWIRRSLLGAMGLFAAVSCFVVTPRMEVLRGEGTEESKARFGQLHGVSTGLAGLTLLLGLVGLALPPREP